NGEDDQEDLNRVGIDASRIDHRLDKVVINDLGTGDDDNHIDYQQPDHRITCCGHRGGHTHENCNGTSEPGADIGNDVEDPYQQAHHQCLVERETDNGHPDGDVDKHHGALKNDTY